MGGRSIGYRAAQERARIRMRKLKMNIVFNPRIKLRKYPKCAGYMEGCPPEITNPKEPPEQCRKCPNFIESKYYTELMEAERIKRVKELAELFESIRKS